jgi:hypothetical protein
MLAYTTTDLFVFVDITFDAVVRLGVRLNDADAGRLLWLKRDALRSHVKQKTMDRGFTIRLLLVSVAGILLQVLRDSRFTALWLEIHLELWPH